MKNKMTFCLWFFLITLVLAPLAGAVDGISEDTILIGQSCALKGPARQLGKGMRDGALAYFEHINANGGIKGKKIKLISLDDGYEPGACKRNTSRLIDKEKVFLLFGYVGTPTSKAAFPLIKAQKVPFFAPFTGAEFLRSPVTTEVFNIRASYYQETEAMVEQLLLNGKNNIGVFYQNDSYGSAGLEGARLALERRGKKIIAKASYERNTVAVNDAVKLLSSIDLDAVIMIGAYAPCARFISKMRDRNSSALFVNVSFVGADALALKLQNKGLGVVISQVVPYPYDKRVEVVAEYHQLLKQYAPAVDPSYPGMEGFIAAKGLTAILGKMKTLTRPEFIRVAEKQYEYLGGFKVKFDADSHQGSDFVGFTQVGPGGFIAKINDFSDLYKYEGN
jgi:ABC-type branched-subunit amino acid transport system substrate-binding protein